MKQYVYHHVFIKCSAVRRPPSAVRRPSSAVRRPPSAVRRPPSAVRRPSSAVRRPPSVVRRPPSAVRRPPSVVRRPSAFYLHPFIYYCNSSMFSQIFVFLYPGKNRRRLSTSSMSLPHCKHNVSWNLEKDRLENILIYSHRKKCKYTVNLYGVLV